MTTTIAPPPQWSRRRSEKQRRLEQVRNLADGLRETIGRLGRDGEAEMLALTGGVNTHRGAIWALGLLTTAAAIAPAPAASRWPRALLSWPVWPIARRRFRRPATANTSSSATAPVPRPSPVSTR